MRACVQQAGRLGISSAESSGVLIELGTHIARGGRRPTHTTTVSIVPVFGALPSHRQRRGM